MTIINSPATPLQAPMTLKEFSKAAGVSTAAASNALSGKGRISDETRERIKALADELGYRPNSTAASLRTGLSKTIGFVIYPDDDPASEQRWAAYNAHLLYSLVSEASRNGYAVNIISAKEPKQLLSSNIDLLYYMDPFDNEQLINEARRLGIPVLANDRHGDDRLCINVDTQFEAMTRAALNLLVAEGSTKPALLTELEGISSDAVAERVYRAWCDENGFTPRVARGNYGRTDLNQRLDELLETGCDAIYSFYEEAPLILEHLHTRGIRVPEDLLLIAAATDAAENTLLDVTTTVFHPEATASRAFPHIMELIKDRSLAPINIELPWEMIELGSSSRN